MDRFDPRLKSIIVTCALIGPTGRLQVRLAVDTGATRTIIRPSVLAFVGSAVTGATRTARMTAATGVQQVPLIDISGLTALGLTRALAVVAHDPPPSFAGQGLLGRDFFAGHILTLDFARSTIGLRRPGWHSRVWG